MPRGDPRIPSHSTNKRSRSSNTLATDDSRVTDVGYSDTTPGIHYTYDAFGRVQTETNSTSTLAYTYDDNDLVTSITTTYPGMTAQTISYTYYPDGSRASMTTPAGTFNYTYDNAGRL